jgi:hypothetical protein
MYNDPIVTYAKLGTVYFASRRSAEDDDMLQLYSSVLLGVTIG